MMRDTKLITHNQRQVAKYLEFRDPLTMKNTAGSFFSNEADRKGESKVPLSEKGHIFWSDRDGNNQHFGKHIRPILREIEDKEVYVPAKLLEHDPTALRRWRAGETENDRYWMKRFDHLCKFVAALLERRNPGLRVLCNIYPEYEEARPKTRQARDKERTWTKEHSYRLIGAEIERVMIEEECSLTAAKGLVAQRTNLKLGTPCSVPRVEKAWCFYRAGREKESA